MNERLEYPLWQAPLAEAILESDLRQLRPKVHKAEEAIKNRMRELDCEQESELELRLLHDGLSILRAIKRDELHVTGIDQ